MIKGIKDMNKLNQILSLILIVSSIVALAGCSVSRKSDFYAGLRASSYGIKPFPEPTWWVGSAKSMASSFEEATPSVIWIIGNIEYPSHMWLGMKKTTETEHEYILFTNVDVNEPYFDMFDEMGIKIWLQVEPGDADVSEIIDIVLSEYNHHPCIIGFGIDVEWFRIKYDLEGMAVTDSEARTWVEKVRSYNPEYRVFLKHWLPEKMPPAARDGLFFIDDTQGFSSLDELVLEFTEWGETFAPAPVGFQFGYLSDQSWWSELENPPEVIGKALIEEVTNLEALYWVDFTAREIWPVD
jgi:hypothetical protein